MHDPQIVQNSETAQNSEFRAGRPRPGRGRRGAEPGHGGGPGRRPGKSGDHFLDHYFRRIEARTAASFTEEQRQAIKTMFGDRGVTRHPIDIRRSFGLGGYRFFLVLLSGRERRAASRERSEHPPRGPRDYLARLALALILLTPFLALAVLFRS